MSVCVKKWRVVRGRKWRDRQFRIYYTSNTTQHKFSSFPHFRIAKKWMFDERSGGRETDQDILHFKSQPAYTSQPSTLQNNIKVNI